MLRVLERLLPKGQFARGVSVLVMGTAGTQGLLVLATPFLTRLYSPDDFGLLAVYSGVLSLLAVASSLRYQLAIPLPENDRDAASVAVLSLLLVLLVSVGTAGLIYLFSEPFVRLLNAPALRPFLWLIPVGLLLSGIYQVLNYWAIRKKGFIDLAKTKVTQSVGQLIVQLAGASLGPVALLIGNVIGQAAGNARLLVFALRGHRSHFQAVTWAGVRQAARRWKRFPQYSIWSGLFNTAGTQLPPILFAALFSPAIAGIYMLATRVLQLPMSLLGQAIAQVFFSSSAEARRAGTLGPLVKQIHHDLARFSMPVTLLLIFTAPDLFALIFGAQWQQAGEFARWMAPWLYLVFVTSPLSQLFSVLEKQAQGMLFQLLLFVVRITALIIGAQTQDVLITIALFSIGSAVCWMGFLWWIIKASGNSLADTARGALKSFMISLLLVSPITVSVLMAPNSVIWLLALGASGALMAGYYYRLARVLWI